MKRLQLKRFDLPSWDIDHATPRGGGGEGVLALEMGRGVPLACSKPSPVAIDWFMVQLLPMYFMFYGLFRLFNICLWNFEAICSETTKKWWNFANNGLRNQQNTCKIQAQKNTPSQFAKLQRDTVCQCWKLEKDTLSSGTSPVLQGMKVPPPPGTPLLWHS